MKLAQELFSLLLKFLDEEFIDYDCDDFTFLRLLI